VFTEDEIKYLNKVSKFTGETFDTENAKVFEPVGCKYCNDIGYYERIALFEVLCVDEYVKDMISDSKSTIDIRKYAMEHTDYKPLISDGIKKVLSGITTIDELKKKIII
jgi:type II secretory ATPase GspE/PulE/Tfp pilus assembly ATPase PilB-like protein